MSVRCIAFVIAVALTLLPSVLSAGVVSDEHLRAMQEVGGAVEHPTAPPPPFYQEHTFMVLTGFAAAVAGFGGLRLVRRRKSRKVAATAFVHEAVLVVDLVNSTYLATHYGNRFAMRARSVLKDRMLEAAEARGMTFAEDTGDGYFMTFPSVAVAVRTATDLLKGLRKQPPDLSPGPSLALRAAVSYGEILLDARDARHGATINKAFRLEGITEKNFTHVEGESKLHDIPDSDRIFLDEEAAQELTASEIPVRSVGFCRLKGFSGLHRVFEVQWENCP